MKQSEIITMVQNEMAKKCRTKCKFQLDTGLKVENMIRIDGGWIIKDTNGTYHKVDN